MILNKKTCELNDVDSLIEQLYLQTKQAYIKAQTSDIKENMSPKDKQFQKTSLTTVNKTVNASGTRVSCSNLEISIAEKSSESSSNDNLNIRGTSSNFETSINNRNSDFKTLTGVEKNSSSSCEISITETEFDSKLECLKMEYSKIKRLSIDCDSAIALQRKLGNKSISSDTKLVSSSKNNSKVVVQVLPPIEFGDKFDLLKSGISNNTFGFKPYSFSPTPSISSLVHQRSSAESSLSEEESLQEVRTEKNSKNRTSNKKLVVLNSREKKRKRIEERNSHKDRYMESETNISEKPIRSSLSEEEYEHSIAAATNTKNVTSNEGLVNSNEKKRKLIEDSNSVKDNMSSETNHINRTINGECEKSTEDAKNTKNVTSNDGLESSNEKKRKQIEDSNSVKDNMLSETNHIDRIIKSSLFEKETEQSIETATKSKVVTSNSELVLFNSNALTKEGKLIEESNSINDSMSSETNPTDTIIRKLLKRNVLNLKSNGVKLCDIEYIAPKLAVASVAVIRTLHYILYGSYGLTRNEILMCQTIENILQFNGFPFYEESEIFRKKRNLLVNLPSVLYVRIYDILMNYSPKQKQTSLDKLLSFLKQPSDNFQENEITEEERVYEKLKEKALQARPVVKIQKLDEALVNIFHKRSLEALETTSQKITNKSKSSPQRKQPNLQLKAIPGIAENIQNARRRIINLLHSLLYGRPGSEDINRKNILEFNGFKSRHKNFLARRLAFLSRLKMKEIEQLCDVVTVPSKSGNKNTKIKKLLNFFSFLEPHQKKSTTSPLTAEKPKTKLRNFEKIYTNVECSTPEDLTPLNDILYVKPCDNSEIHQKILDFSSFSFDISSFDFQYRRTLMHYMNLKTVKQIARILDIEDWESCTNQSELSLRILKFLLDLKLPEKKKLRAEKKYKREKTHPHILKFHSSNTERRYHKSRSCTPETFDSTYASEEVNDIECEEHTSTSVYNRQNAPNSRLHFHQKSLSDKHNQILNDSTPLLDLMQHPTDKELLSQVDKIINNSSLSITIGELVQQVLNNYPKFDLHYRIDFIKAKALEVLQELRLSATVFS